MRVGPTFYGKASGAIMMSGGLSAADALKSPSAYAAPQPGGSEAYMDIAMWGANNNLPAEMAADIEATGVLASGIDAKARITIGRGPQPARIVSVDANGQEELEFINDAEITDWLEAHRAFETSYATVKDLLGMGQSFIQILLSTDRTQIVGFKRQDPVQSRLSKVDPKSGRSEWCYLSADWNQWANWSADADKHMSRVALLDKDYPLYDLQQRTTGYTFSLCIQYPLTGRSYYAPAPWYAARRWVKIAQSIPEMKAAMFANQITIKYMVEVHPDFWPVYRPEYSRADTQRKQAIQDEFYAGVDLYLAGGNNAYKSLFSVKLPNNAGGEPISAVTVTAIDDKIKDGKLLPDGAAANTEILFALMINPALIGLDAPGGAARTAGSGSNIREAYLVQVMMGEVERRMNSTVFNLAKHYNGWDKRIVLRYPNQILTTLNEGANTKSTA